MLWKGLRNVDPLLVRRLDRRSLRPLNVANAHELVHFRKSCRQCKQFFAGAQERHEMSCRTNQGLNLAGCQNRYNW
jgi:hypothetical protein